MGPQWPVFGFGRGDWLPDYRVDGGDGGAQGGNVSGVWGELLLHRCRLSVRPSISLRTNGQPRWSEADVLGAGGGTVGGVLAGGPRCWWAGALDSGSGAGMTGWGEGLVAILYGGCPCALRFPSGRTDSLVGARGHGGGGVLAGGPRCWRGRRSGFRLGGRNDGLGGVGGRATVLAGGPRCWRAGALDSGSGAGMTGWGGVGGRTTMLVGGPRCWWAGVLDSGSGAGMTGWGLGLVAILYGGCPCALRFPPSRASGQAQDERTASLGAGGGGRTAWLGVGGLL